MNERVEAILENIRLRLDELQSLFILANEDKLRAAKERLLPSGSIKERIYNMCDRTKTAADMAQEIEKGTGYVYSYLSTLRREGLIRNVEIEGEQVYEQVF